MRAAAALKRRAEALHLQLFIAPAFALGIGALLLVVFQHLSQSVDYRSVIRHLWNLTPSEWMGAVAATAVSFVALVGRDAVGLRYLGARVPRGALGVGARILARFRDDIRVLILLHGPNRQSLAGHGIL